MNRITKGVGIFGKLIVGSGGIQIVGNTSTKMLVTNKSGSTIAQDKIVYISSYDITTGAPAIATADADAGSKFAQYVVVDGDIANNAQGYVVKRGLSSAVLNTNSASAVGSPAYLSTTAGAFTFTAPTASNAIAQEVGRVVVKSATVGQIQWDIQQPVQIGSNELQANSVLVGKLTSTLGGGFIDLPLAVARAINGSAEIGVIAVGGAGTVGSGGILGSDGSTAPNLKRRNVGTDPTVDIAWPAGITTEVAWQFTIPPDMDVTATSALTVLTSMGGAMDTPVVAVKCVTGVGGSNLGGNTAALTQAEAAFAVTIAANSFTNLQQAIATLLPAAHANDALRLRAFYFQYTRK